MGGTEWGPGCVCVEGKEFPESRDVTVVGIPVTVLGEENLWEAAEAILGV